MLRRSHELASAYTTRRDRLPLRRPRQPACARGGAGRRARGVDRYILGGDYALFGGWPGETVARLRELEPAIWIRGNGDRWTADDAPDGPDRATPSTPCRAALGDALVGGARRAARDRRADGDTLICHGSPVSDVRSFLPEPAEDEAELLEGVTASRLLFGHTHVPFRRMAGADRAGQPRLGRRAARRRPRAPPMRCCTTTGGSSTGASPTTTWPALRRCARSAASGPRPSHCASSARGWRSVRAPADRRADASPARR